MRILAFFFLALTLAPKAEGSGRLGFESNFVIDNQSISSNADASNTIADGYLNLNFSKSSGIGVALGGLYTQRELAVTATERSTLTGLNPYAGITIGFGGRHQIFSLGAFVAPFVQATYKETGSEVEKWQGTAYFGKISLSPKLSNSFTLTASLTFFSANYSTKGTTAAVSTVESYQSSTIFPMVGLQYFWGE